MQLTNCEYTLDKAKVIFMYTSDDRVDFRELLKELAVVFKCRIELRQIGPRDKAKVIGGIVIKTGTQFYLFEEKNYHAYTESGSKYLHTDLPASPS